MVYREDIQILRGVSVILVVAFHLELGVFDSGFFGVDIFFVISGFLMALLYQPGKAMEFFARRARRLLPAYFVTVLAVLVASFFMVLPHEFDGVATQADFAMAFASNFGFWMDNSYFDKATFKPLLHLWSLGVEIQFYLVVPILFWVFRKSRHLIFVVAILSLAGCFIVTGVSPKTSFFLTPFRIWEFLCGAIVAVHLTNAGAVRYPRLAVLSIPAFVLIIGLSGFATDGEALGAMLGHPGVKALVVTLAASVILATGMPPAISRSAAGRALEKIGELSYSVYLVHFPVLVLFLYVPFEGTNLSSPSPVVTLIALVLIVVLSLLMYYCVEAPFRKKMANSRKIVMPALVVIALSGFSAAFAAPVQRDLFNSTELLISDAWLDRSVYRCGKLARIVEPGAQSCGLNEVSGVPRKRMLLVGNSHADALKSAFAEIATKNNVSLRLMVQNESLGSPAMSVSRILKEAAAYKIDTIILHDSPGAADVKSISDLVVAAGQRNIKVVLIDPVPIWNEHVPQALWDHVEHHAGLPRQTLDDYRRHNEKFFAGLATIKADNFARYRTGHFFCKPLCLLSAANGKPLYFDPTHLTITGSMMLHDVFADIAKAPHGSSADD